jgi:hypothetical protein
VLVASSSRSQVAVRTASAAARLTWDQSSVSVRWRPPLAMAIVTHLVTQSLTRVLGGAIGPLGSSGECRGILGYLRRLIQTCLDLRSKVSKVLIVSGEFTVPCALDVPCFRSC